MNNIKEYIPIVLCINDSYIFQATALLSSICDNTNKDILLEFNILHSSVTIQNQSSLKSSLSKYENIKDINFIDMKSIVSNDFLEQYMAKIEDVDYISPETYYRFFIPNIFKQYNKILYLDADMIVLNDISKLYSIDIEKYYAGVVLDRTIDNLLKRNKKIEIIENYTWKKYITDKLYKKELSYFNAGMLLLNLQKLRQDNIQDKLFDFLIKQWPLQYQDQDVLNSVFDCNVKYLDEKYNYQCNKDLKEIIVLHFIGKSKPWNTYKTNETFELYWKYLKQTNFWNKDIEKKYNLLKDKYIEIKLFSYTIFKFFQDNRHYKIKILFIHFTINKKWIH